MVNHRVVAKKCGGEMRRGYLDFTTMFAQTVDLATMMPRGWNIVGSLASPLPNVVRLVFENELVDDGPFARLNVEVHDGPLKKTITVTMEEITANDVVDAVGSVRIDDERGPVPSCGPSDRPTVVKPRFFLGHDDSGHRYAVPVARRGEWETWSNNAAGADCDPPSWAERVEGGFTFTDPRDGD